MTFSAVSAGSAWGSTGPGSGPSHSANEIHSAERSSPAIGPACRSTATCGCSRRGECGRTSCAAGSRARTSALRDGAAGSRASEAGCGRRWRESSASADRVGSSLRTSLACEAGARTGCSPTWRRSVTRAGHSWWVLSMPGPRTGGGGSSSSHDGLLPTPLARDWKCGSTMQRVRRRACPLSDVAGGLLNPVFVEWMMGFPAGWTG